MSACRARRRGRGAWPRSTRSASRARKTGSATIRISSPAGCVSAWPSPSRCCTSPISSSPTSRPTALDVTIQGQILALVQRICRDRGTAMIWITHDLAVVAGIADRIAVMYAGRIVEIGPVDAVIDRPRASLHPRPHRIGPRPRRQGPAARANRGADAGADEPAARLRLRAALRPGHAGLHRGGAGDAPDRPRAGRPLHPSAGGGSMSGDVILRARGLTRHFGGGGDVVARALARVGLARPRPVVRAVEGRELRPASRRSTGRRGRVRLRQVHAGPDGGRAAAAERRDDRGRPAVRRGRQARDANGVPGPVLVAQSAQARVEPRGRGTARAPHRLAAGTGRLRGRPDGALRDRRGVPRPLRARVLGRPAPAHRDSTRAGREARDPRLRRGGVRARRVDPGADREPLHGPAGRAWPDLPVYQPRPRRRGAHLRPHPRHVPGPRGRDRPPPRPCSRTRATPTRARSSRACPGSTGAACATCRSRGTSPRPSTRLRAATSIRAAPSRRRAAASSVPPCARSRPDDRPPATSSTT